MAVVDQFEYDSGEKAQSIVDAGSQPTAQLLSAELLALPANQRANYQDWNKIRTKLREIIPELNNKVETSGLVSAINSALGNTNWQTKLTQEEVQDFVATLFTHANHTNVTVTYDDANGQILISSSASGGSLTQEEVQDFVAGLFTHASHTNISATYDDANNRIVLALGTHGHPASEIDFGQGTTGYVWTSDGAGGESWQVAPGAGAGSGDMTKAVYDPNDDGKVTSAVNADVVPWTGITGKPSFLGVSNLAEFESAVNAAITAGLGSIYVTSEIDISSGTTFTVNNNADISIVGVRGIKTFNAGSRFTPMFNVTGNGAKIKFYDTYTDGGTQNTSTTGTAWDGFALVNVDESTCSELAEFTLRSSIVTNGWAILRADWNGDSGLLRKWTIENVFVQNLDWIPFLISGLHGTGKYINVATNTVKQYGIRVGDEAIDFTLPKFTDPLDANYVDTSYFSLTFANIDNQNITGAINANGVHVQGVKNFNMINAIFKNCVSDTGLDSEGFYGKILNGNISNVTIYDCLGEALFNIKGGAPENNTGSQTPTKRVLCSNIQCVITPAFKAAHPTQRFRGILLRSDDIAINGYTITNCHLPINIYASDNANYTTDAVNPVDPINGKISLRGGIIDGGNDTLIYIQGTKCVSLDIQAYVKNYDGLLDDTRQYIVQETNCHIKHREYDIEVHKCESGLGANSYLLKTNCNSGETTLKLIAKGDAIGRLIDFNDQSQTNMYVENYITSITNKLFNIRSSAKAPWLEYKFVSGLIVTDEVVASGTIADGTDNISFSHGLGTNPGRDQVFAFAADGTPLAISSTDATNLTVSRTGTSGSLDVYWKALNLTLR